MAKRTGLPLSGPTDSDTLFGFGFGFGGVTILPKLKIFDFLPALASPLVLLPFSFVTLTPMTPRIMTSSPRSTAQVTPCLCLAVVDYHVSLRTFEPLPPTISTLFY